MWFSKFSSFDFSLKSQNISLTSTTVINTPMKPFLFFFLFLFLGTLSFSQNLTVRGFVYDQSNGEPMGYEKVKILKLDSTIVAGAITDLNGFFQIPKLVRDKYILKISNQKYETAYKNIDFNNGRSIIDVKFELRLSEGVQEFDEVRVSAESRTKRTQIEISKQIGRAHV